jgi:hypothetical protein
VEVSIGAASWILGYLYVVEHYDTRSSKKLSKSKKIHEKASQPASQLARKKGFYRGSRLDLYVVEHYDTRSSKNHQNQKKSMKKPASEPASQPASQPATEYPS